MYGLLLGVHIVICASLIIVVLLQAGKGGGLAGAFGAAGGQTGQTLFGGRGAATFLSKATTVLGAAFMTTTVILAVLQANASGPQSVIRDVDPGTMVPAASAPAPALGELPPLTTPGDEPGNAVPGDAGSGDAGQIPVGDEAPGDSAGN